MADIHLKIHSDLVEEVKEVFDELPAGTKRRMFRVRNEADNVTVVATVFFLPDGTRRFRYITENLGETLFAYSSAEVNAIHLFNKWLADNKGKLYPTDEHPAGLPLEAIEQHEPDKE